MFLLNKQIAHRGLHNIDEGMPENSLAAFSNAILYRFPIELDVHLTADNQIVVFHDNNLNRMCSIDLLIENSNYEELKNYKLLQTNEHIPLLTEVLETVNGTVPLLIEIKDGTKTGILEEKLVNLLKTYKGEYALQAFDPKRILWLKNNFPKIKRGQLSCYYDNSGFNIFKKFILKHMLLNFLSKPDFISYDVTSMPNKIINKLKKSDIPIFAWTVRTKEQFNFAINYCDSVIFENFLPENNK